MEGISGKQGHMSSTGDFMLHFAITMKSLYSGRPEYLTKREGGHYKGTDWSEMQGGVTWSWKWGNIGMVKDRQQWGNNYNGANIFGGNNPTFVQLRLHLRPVKMV